MNRLLLKRPLAFLGGAYFVFALVAVLLPAGVLLPLALLFIAGFFIFVLFSKKRRLESAKKADEKHRSFYPTLALLLPLILSFLSVFTFSVFKVQPLQKLAGEEYHVTAQVVRQEASANFETSDVTLKILNLSGGTKIPPFTVNLQNFSEVEIGDILTLDLKFYVLKGRTKIYNNANGIYIGARAVSVPIKTSEKIDLLCYFRILQKAAAQNIMDRLPYNTGAVASAMAVGSDEFLQWQTIALYRKAGLSHLLTVSGIHFSILCTLLAQLVSNALKRKKLASALCIAFVLCFAAFTGLEPAVVRSAIAYLLVFSANIFTRKPDMPTSLGFAAILITVANPFAVLDVGVWLSFTATAGVMLGAHLCKIYPLRTKALKKPHKNMLGFLYEAFSVSFFASFVTLPILAVAGFGVSLAGVPLNMLSLPFAYFTVPFGLLLALPLGFAPLDFLLKAIALFEAFCIKSLDFIASLGGGLGGTFFVGTVVTAALFIAVLLVVLGLYKKRLAAFALLSCAFILFSLSLQFTFEKDLVRIEIAGNNETASLVITQNNKAIVLYKSVRGIIAINNALEKSGADCVLFVDLRANTQNTRHTQFINADKTLEAKTEVAYKMVLHPLQNITVYLLRQADGFLACVSAGGYTVGIYTGRINVLQYPPLDLLVAGQGEALGNFAGVLAGDSVPNWAQNHPNLCYNKGQAAVLVRPYTSFKSEEIQTL